MRVLELSIRRLPRSSIKISGIVTNASIYGQKSFHDGLGSPPGAYNLSVTEALKSAHDGDNTFAVAQTALSKGTWVHGICGSAKNKPTMYTIQLDKNYHVEPLGGAQFISHGCYGSANCRVVISDGRRNAKLLIIKDIDPDEAVRFNYNSTEWDIISGFICECPKCVSRCDAPPRYISGFKHLSLQDRERLGEFTSPYIHEMALKEAVSHIKSLQNRLTQ